MLKQKAQYHFQHHDGDYCLEMRNGESWEDFLESELVHFLIHHRWWAAEDVRKELVYEPGLNKYEHIKEIFLRASNCK